MQILPELSESLASELVRLIENMDRPFQTYLEEVLKLQPYPGGADLKAGLTEWLGEVDTTAMVKRYTLVRQLVRTLEQVNRTGGCL